MKIKADFVTNSSSAAFIVMIKQDQYDAFDEYVDNLDSNPDYGNNGVRIWDQWSTKKELFEYATDRPYDWASKAMAPKLKRLSQEAYNEALEAIKDGFVVIHLGVDNNACEEFEDSSWYEFAQYDQAY